MSNHNLAKVPLEAGHRAHYVLERDRTTQKDRRAGRKFSRDASRGADPEAAPPKRDRTGLWGSDDKHADKLGAVRRWLMSKVGQHWDDVFSEICTKFSSGTLAGRHIQEHVRGFVSSYEDFQRYGSSYHRNGTLYRDEANFLRFVPRQPRSTTNGFDSRQFVTDCKDFFRDREVIREGAILFWATSHEVPAYKECYRASSGRLPACQLPHTESPSKPGVPMYQLMHKVYDRGTRLTKDEVGTLRGLQAVVPSWYDGRYTQRNKTEFDGFCAHLKNC